MWSFSMYLHVCDACESSTLLLGLAETSHWAQSRGVGGTDRRVILQQGPKIHANKVVFSTQAEKSRVRKSLK